jgi:hypothetical protein
VNNFFTYLNVAIGASFIYLILSLLISELQENITGILELRARNLKSSLINLLEGKTRANTPENSEIIRALYNTSVIKSINQGKKDSKGPSYIPKELFSTAIVEVLKTRYDLKIEKEDDINTIANKIDDKIYEYQGMNPSGNDGNIPSNPDSVASTSASSDIPLGDPLPVDDAIAQASPETPVLIEESPIVEPLGETTMEPTIEPTMLNSDGSSSFAISPDFSDTVPIAPEISLPVPRKDPTLNTTPSVTIPKDSDIHLLTNLSTLARRIQTQVDDQEVKLIEFQKGLADWFDQSMVRAGGTYKRNAKLYSFCLGLLVAVLANVDSITMIDRLYKNQSLSDTATQLANQVIQNNSQAINNLNKANNAQERNKAIQPIKENINVVVDQISAFPIGWNLPKDFNVSLPAWLTRIVGWLISALAFSMGAPFWFELLSKFMNVRNAGQKPSTGDTDAPRS